MMIFPILGVPASIDPAARVVLVAIIWGDILESGERR